VSKVSEVEGLLQKSRQLLLWETGSCGRGEFENPEEGERPLLEPATKQRLVNYDVTGYEDVVCPTVVCEVCRMVRP
jgi:hypothetical protein